MILKDRVAIVTAAGSGIGRGGAEIMGREGAIVVANFVAGPLNTLPIYVFSSIRRGVTPEINAIGTAIMMFSLVMLFGAQLLLRRKSAPQRA